MGKPTASLREVDPPLANPQSSRATKKGPLVGWLVRLGDEELPSYIEIIMNHEIRIPMNQPVSCW